MRYVTPVSNTPTARYKFFDSTVEQEIYTAIAECPRTAIGTPIGLTCDEIVVKHRMLHQTASSALSKLCKLGYIHDSGHKRMSQHGRRQRVYVL